MQFFSRVYSGRIMGTWKCLCLATALLFSALCISAHATDGEQKIAELGTCKLASGEVILDCRVGYRTFGTLNSERTNVVVVPTWLNGRTVDMLSLFGATASKDRLVDTSKFFGVAFDALGDG